MPNGKLGDHPLTDIVLHGAATFTPEIDALVKEVHHLGGFENELGPMYLSMVESQLRQADERAREGLLSQLRWALERERDAIRVRDHVRKGGKSR